MLVVAGAGKTASPARTGDPQLRRDPPVRRLMHSSDRTSQGPTLGKHLVVPMTSPRTHCPKCQKRSAKSVKHLFASANGEYFACIMCEHVWLVLAGPGRTVLELVDTTTAVADSSARLTAR